MILPLEDPRGSPCMAGWSYGGTMLRRVKPYQLAIDVSVPAAAAALVGFVLTDVSASGFPWVVTTLGMAICLAFRRISPPIALGLAWATAVYQMVNGLDPQVANLAILPVLFATALYGSQTVKWIGFASTFVGAVVVALYLVAIPGILNPSDLATSALNAGGAFIASLALFMLSWVLGLLAKIYATAAESRRAQARAEQEQESAEQAVMVEQERTRIARDMHDVVAHSLAVVIAQADGARYARALHPETVDEALETISTTAREALGDVRVLLGQLRHSEIEGPQPVLDDVDRLLDQMRGSGLRVQYAVVGRRMSLARSQQLALYRIVQESLTNVLRHGDTSHVVEVTVRWNEENVMIAISSGLTGPMTLPLRQGHGLAGMRERATIVGGWLTADIVGERFVVNGSVPRVPGQTGAIQAVAAGAER